MTLNESLKSELRSQSSKARAALKEFEQTKVRAALIGETGAGKSSLINAIVGSKVAKTGGIGETTQQAQEVPYEEFNGFAFCDLPGCGTPNHPRETYIEEQGLLRKYDLFILVTEKRIRQGDELLYRILCKEHQKPFFVVRTHFDQVIDETSEPEARRLITEDIRKQFSAGDNLTPYMVASKGPKTYDLGTLIEDIVDSLSGLKKDRAVMAVAAETEGLFKKKRAAAEKIVNKYAIVSAANGLNPIPGLDISVDIGLLSNMAQTVISAYGLQEDQLDYAVRCNRTAEAMRAVRQIAKPATQYLAKEAIFALLKRLGTRVTAKSVSKWIPLVGQAVAAYIGYQLTSSFGEQLIGDCEKAAREVHEFLRLPRQ